MGGLWDFVGWAFLYTCMAIALYCDAYRTALRTNRENYRYEGLSFDPKAFSEDHPYHFEDGTMYTAIDSEIIKKDRDRHDFNEGDLVRVSYPIEGRHIHTVNHVWFSGTIWVEVNNDDINFNKAVPVKEYRGG